MKRILVVILVIILLLILRDAVLSIIDLNSSNQRLSDLKKDLNDEKVENAFLQERLKYVQTNEFIENEARNKLGFVKEDEYVIFAPPPSKKQEPTPLAENPPNWRKWLNLFI